ncbi:hypothetical protein KKE60_06110 [Patescibacteria group bacterium]|nr:hypothetical protein [Patescibacteria group bacterium]
MIKAYPKIFSIGTDYIKDIFNEDVETKLSDNPSARDLVREFLTKKKEERI